MEEIKLHFNENDFRVFYENCYSELQADLKRQLASRRKVLSVLIILTVISFSLTFVDKRWINYGLIPFFATTLFMLWTQLIKSSVKKHIDDGRIGIAKFISDIKNVNEVKYVYDNYEINYYESTVLKYTSLWTDMYHVEYLEEGFILYFNQSDQVLIFIRSMISKADLKKFEQLVVKKIKNAR